MKEENIFTVYLIFVIAIILTAFGIIITRVIEVKQKNNKNKKQNNVQRQSDQKGQLQQVQRPQPVFEKLPYFLKSSVLTNYEMKLYYVLAPFCSRNNLILFSKVRLADFVQTYQGRNFYHWFNRISSKHVDFLICQPGSFKPLLAVELDDYTHRYKDRQDRDYFVNCVYYSVGLPVLHISEINSVNIEQNISVILGLNVSTIL